jgi:hypothetical protein
MDHSLVRLVNLTNFGRGRSGRPYIDQFWIKTRLESTAIFTQPLRG